jgi:hypothetical protein
MSEFQGNKFTGDLLLIGVILTSFTCYHSGMVTVVKSDETNTVLLTIVLSVLLLITTLVSSNSS